MAVKRARDAVNGRFITLEESKRRPRETIVEKRPTSLRPGTTTGSGSNRTVTGDRPSLSRTFRGSSGSNSEQDRIVEQITRLAASLGKLLQASDAQVTTAESCTGGGIAEAITRIGGSSAWFEAGYVTYSNAQKTRQLDVPATLFDAVGAVSEEVVRAMVRGAQRNSGARYAVAVSGVAGPGGGSAHKPVGTVWLCWGAGERLTAERRQFAGDRDQVRRQTVEAALEGLIRIVSGEMPNQG